MKTGPLFLDGDLRATLDANLERARQAADAIPETEFRESDPSKLATEIFSRFAVTPIELTEGAVSVQAEDADIDRRRFRDMDHGFPGASPTLRGTRVIYNVPYTGDPALFRLKPSTWTTTVPYAAVTRDEVRYVYDVPSAEVAATKGVFERDLAETKRWLAWSNKQVDEFNTLLVTAVEGAVNARASRLAAASAGLAALGLPVRAQAPARVSRARPEITSSSASQAEENQEYDVALSFAGEDRRYVQEVAAHLTSAGITVFFDEFESVRLWGKDLVAHLQDIYQNRARFCVMFISEHYVTKPWPSHERRSAQARALVAKEEYLLPARFDDTTVPGMPPTIGYVDLRSLTPEQFANMILKKVRPRGA
jgi:hypothetical protein